MSGACRRWSGRRSLRGCAHQGCRSTGNVGCCGAVLCSMTLTFCDCLNYTEEDCFVPY